MDASRRMLRSADFMGVSAVACSVCATAQIQPNSRVAERVAPQASLAPAQAPLAWGALSERLVPPFLQSVSLSCKVRVIGAPSATLSAKRFTLLYKDALPQRQSSVFTQRKLPEPHTLKNFRHGVRATRNPLNNPR